MARQAGMTLIELTVVLLVLIGLAGLMIPYVSGFIGKTHDATGASNIGAAGNAIVRFETEKGRYPDYMDSMLVGAAAGGTAALVDYTIADKMGTAGDLMCGGVAGTAAGCYGFSAIDLTVAGNDEVCGALLKAGIDKVIDMDNGTAGSFNATFSNADVTTPSVVIGVGGMAPACTGGVVGVTSAKVASALGLDPATIVANQYVAFGIGAMTEMNGETMTDAPVHFAKDADYNASQAYNRFVAIFQVDNDTAEDLSAANAMRAKYVGSTMAMMGLVGKEGDLKGYYSTASE